jgi:hypothetical protein
MFAIVGLVRQNPLIRKILLRQVAITNYVNPL